MTTIPTAAGRPTVVPFRWRNPWKARADVCAVITGPAVTWVVRDILEAVEDDPGDYSAEPGHDPLVIAEHVTCSAWSLDTTRRNLAGLDPRVTSLINWMHGREQSFAELGLGNIARLASPDLPTSISHAYSVRTAARHLSTDPAIRLGEQQLFQWLLEHDWIVRRGREYEPTTERIVFGHLAVVPRRVPVLEDPWPQVVIAPAGFTALHHDLGGTAALDLESQP